MRSSEMEREMVGKEWCLDVYVPVCRRHVAL